MFFRVSEGRLDFIRLLHLGESVLRERKRDLTNQHNRPLWARYSGVQSGDGLICGTWHVDGKCQTSLASHYTTCLKSFARTKS